MCLPVLAASVETAGPSAHLQVVSGSVRYLCLEYYNSSVFRELAPKTKKVRVNSHRFVDALIDNFGSK